MGTFEDKAVVITGGTSGIGKATALAFSREGANVVISGRRISEGEKVVREITSAGGNALFVRTDVNREEDIIALIEKTVETFGALHIAFNNAGSEGQQGLLTTEQTVEHYRQVCDTNALDEARNPSHASLWRRCHREYFLTRGACRFSRSFGLCR